jgi:two-component system, NarL family, invasion response regulator UvrY
MGKINISIVDDHRLFREGIAELINHFEGYHVLNQFSSGKEFLTSIQLGTIPDLVVLDIQMPGMDGEEVALWLRKYSPAIKVLSLSMYDDEMNILRMIKAGSRGYVLKSAEPEELKLALDQIVSHNYYHSDLVANTLMKSLGQTSGTQLGPQLNFISKDLDFLKLICSELTYKQMADQLNVSMRTIDGYRESLFERCQAKSRVGLAMFAIKNNLVKI